MDTAKIIFSMLDKIKMEQKAFAAELGTTDKTVSAWRTGRSKSYVKYIPQIAEVLGTTVGYLLTGEDPTSRFPDSATIKVSGRHQISAEAVDVAFAFDDLSPEAQKEVIAFIEFKAAQESGK